jgi:hypothetical protein
LNFFTYILNDRHFSPSPGDAIVSFLNELAMKFGASHFQNSLIIGTHNNRPLHVFARKTLKVENGLPSLFPRRGHEQTLPATFLRLSPVKATGSFERFVPPRYPLPA